MKYVPAYEDGTDRVFRNVAIYNPDAGELPRRKHKIFFTCFRLNMFVGKCQVENNDYS